jgi:hypothetical protein
MDHKVSKPQTPNAILDVAYGVRSHEYQGRVAIGTFLCEIAHWRGGRRYKLTPTRANTQPAFGCYRWDEDAQIAHFTGLLVLNPQGRTDRRHHQLHRHSVPPRFGLPRTLRL